MSPLEFYSPFPTPVRRTYCDDGRSDLRAQIDVIRQTDAARARMLDLELLSCRNWNRYELSKLGRHGLDLSRVVANPGLRGGMIEGGEIALKILVGVIEIALEGNKKEVEAQRESALIEAKAPLPGGLFTIGHHKGDRTLSEGRRSWKTFFMFPRYSLVATGPGSFNSSDVDYEGKFYNNLFDDMTGEARLIVRDAEQANSTEYVGCFRQGKSQAKVF